MDFHLDTTQRQHLRQLQKQLIGKSEYVRVTVLLMLDLGQSLELVQQSLGIDHTTIYRYVQAFRQGGSEALLANRYRGYWGGLNSQQIAQLQTHLQTQFYTSAGALCHWIQARFGVHYHPQGLVKLLHRIGFAYKKTHLIPQKPDLQAQATFLADLQLILDQRPDDQAIYFSDAVHFRHTTRSGYAWIEVGHQRVVATNAYQPCLHLNGAINAFDPTDLIIQPVEKRITAQTTIAFYEQIQTQQPTQQAILVICDRARVHTAQAVQDWLKTSRIRQVLLPAYSPNLNLIERLWKWVRKNVIDFCYYDHFSRFRAAVLAWLTNPQSHREELNRLMTLRFAAP